MTISRINKNIFCIFYDIAILSSLYFHTLRS